MELNECAICVEPFSAMKHRKIICEYCDFTACKLCMEKWILTETVPSCMNNACDREWTHKFIANNFAGNFVKTRLKSHRENVLFDQERALLPATQPIVENMIQCEKLDEQISDEYKHIREIERRIFNLRRTKNQILYKDENNLRKERNVFVKACTVDECRGFLSSQWKCGLCENWTCPDCHEVKGPERNIHHVCNEESKATAALLTNDTKSCPGCGTGIYKIEGCDQMWCTECHTAFSWRTGRVERNIHNPHYYEWMRRNGSEIPANHNEVHCGREINHTFSRVINIRLESNVHTRYLTGFVSSLVRQVIHYRFDVLNRYQINQETNNQELRVQYLRQHINDQEFKTILQRNDKKNRKKRDIYNIYILFVNTVTDILYRFQDLIQEDTYFDNIREPEDVIEIVNVLREVFAIIKYVNECFQSIAKTYSCKPLILNIWNRSLEIPR